MNLKIFLLSKLPSKRIIISFCIFELVLMLIQTYIFFTNKSQIPIQLIITGIISTILLLLLVIYNLILATKLSKTLKELENKKFQNKTLSLLHDNVRCFKHDFNNIIQSIGGYIALNDMNGLEKYYKELFEDCKETNNLSILNPETINNPSIYSILANKYFRASEKGITMTFDIFTDLSNINFNIYELTRILGILLDNAIEAAQFTQEKFIEVEFKADSKKQLFIIRNSCDDNNISTTQIFEKGYSTKENNSGIGLWKVHNILSKRENADLFTTVHDNIFSQQLEIFYEN